MSVNAKIETEILNYIGSETKSDWYVGIATNAEERLFQDHNVDKENGRWIYRDAQSETDARDTEQHLLNNYSFKGGAGGGIRPHYVYAYKITRTTKE